MEISPYGVKNGAKNRAKNALYASRATMLWEISVSAKIKSFPLRVKAISLPSTIRAVTLWAFARVRVERVTGFPHRVICTRSGVKSTLPHTLPKNQALWKVLGLPTGTNPNFLRGISNVKPLAMGRSAKEDIERA